MKGSLRIPVIKDTEVTILIKSSKLSIKDLEKITTSLVETLSSHFIEKTLETERKDLRVSDSRENGRTTSYSIVISV